MGCRTNKSSVFTLLGDPWVLLLLESLRSEERRFSDLQRILGINPITLTNRLKSLEENRLLERLTNRENRQAVVYRLTPLGCKTFPILDALGTFGTMMPATRLP